MPTFQLPYGQSRLTATLPDWVQTTLLSPAEVSPASDPAQIVDQALETPVDGTRLSDFKGVRSVAIAVNDKTRPVPHKDLLPPLLARLEGLGLPPKAITLLIATGAHPPMPPEEFSQVVPNGILARYPIICHDATDQESLVHLRQTRRGTPVWINRTFAEADLRLVVGNMEPHQFMGFSGGVKSAVIGLAGLATINHNHSLMTDPEAKLGSYENNPARQDVEEIGRIVGVHFALNAILNDHKQIVTVLAGAPQAVMHSGIPLVRQLYQVVVPEPFEAMIVSPGGYPKDINMYQAQKGLAHATLVTKKGGTIILVAACPEGTGSAKYEQWMQGMTSHQAVFERFAQEGFRVGPHKAFQYARDALQVRVLFLSDLPSDFIEGLLLTPVDSLDRALALTLADLPPEARIGVMPLANATIPVLDKK